MPPVRIRKSTELCNLFPIYLLLLLHNYPISTQSSCLLFFHNILYLQYVVIFCNTLHTFCILFICAALQYANLMGIVVKVRNRSEWPIGRSERGLSFTGRANMKNITLVCSKCQKSADLQRDAATGLWELPNGYSSISNLSPKYLEDMWHNLHAQTCVKKVKTRFRVLNFNRKSA